MVQIGRIILILQLLFVTFTAFGQNPTEDESDTQGLPLVIDNYKLTNPYLNTHNASGLALTDKLEYANIYLGTEFSNGSFHRPQEAKKYNNYLFSAEGAVNLGSFYVTGGFLFNQAYKKGIQFNSICNPFRGTPYIIADSTGGDWTMQSYQMQAKIVSPFVGDWISFGLEMGIGVDRGAKKIDPRPQSNTNNIDIYPSITIKPGGGNAIGGSFNYSRFREDVNLMLYDSSEPQKLYLLKGMGQYTYDIFSTVSRDRKYSGDKLGGSISYSYHSKRLSVLVSAEHNSYVEEVSDIEMNKPKLQGRLYQLDNKLNLDVQAKSNQILHKIQGYYAWSEYSGREIIQVFNSSPEVNAWITQSEAPRRSLVEEKQAGLEYSFVLYPENGKYYNWKITLGNMYKDFNDSYQALESYMKYKSNLTGLSIEKNITMEKYYLSFGINGAFHKVWDNSMSYILREESDHTIFNGLIEPDYLIVQSDFIYGALNAMFGYRIGNRQSIWVKAMYGRKEAQNGNDFNRNDIAVKVGYTF